MRQVICCGLILLWAAVASAGQFVKDGSPQGEFVLATDAPQGERFAVSDVRDWIEKITGAKVPILAAPSRQANMKVFVGTAYAGDFERELARLNSNDGFAVRRKGNHVYVFGSRPRGTLYGLYALLEKNTDLIFARPHEEFGTVFGNTPDLELAATDFIDVPVFLNRRFGPNWPVHRATGEWLLRNRDNTRDVRANYEGFLDLDLIEPYGTNFAVPIAGHQEKHPEYFGYNPTTKARRFVKHGEGTMCLSVPGLPAIWARGLADNVARHEARFGRKVEHVRLGPGDNWFCCQCEKCVAPLTLPDGSRLTCKDPDSIKDPLFRSTQIMMFINEAMPTWQQLRPDIRIHVLAYIHVAEPPRVAVHPELGIWFAPYPTSNLHFPLLDPRQPEPWGRRFAKWLTMNDRLGFYEYFEAKPSPCDDFKATTRTKGTSDAPQSTVVKAAHDGEHLYLKLTASDRTVGKQRPKPPAAGPERWPQGDRIEFWVFGGRDSHVFAFNAAGVRYDAKNLNRAWDSGWELRTRRTQHGWEAVAVLPMSTFGFTSGKATHWRWFCTRQIRREGGSTDRMSYQGRPLYYRNFPIVVE